MRPCEAKACPRFKLRRIGAKHRDEHCEGQLSLF
jgi:hypothetical protein